MDGLEACVLLLGAGLEVELDVALDVALSSLAAGRKAWALLQLGLGLRPGHHRRSLMPSPAGA